MPDGQRIRIIQSSTLRRMRHRPTLPVLHIFRIVPDFGHPRDRLSVKAVT
jgi:hypothetical protein